MNGKRCIDELERLALIRRGSLATDRRPRTLFLTETGEAMAHDIGRLVQVQQDWFVGSMSPDEVRNREGGLEWLETRLRIGVVEHARNVIRERASQ